MKASDQILLVRVTGPDRPGIAAVLTSALAEQDAAVLDVNQAVIHETVLLGMLIAMPAHADAARALGSLHLACNTAGLSLWCGAVGPDDYQHWVGQQGKPRFILTLLAREIQAATLAAVADMVAAQGLNIDVITRLSGRPRLDGDDRPRRACVEMSLRGEPVDPEGLRRRLLDLSHEINVDLAWQRDSVYRRTRRLVAFDMDSTLIQHEVIDELAAEAGAGAEVAAITEAAMRGEIDFDESLRRRVASLAGLPETVLGKVAGRLLLTEGAQTLCHNLHRFGYTTAILSGGFTYFGRFLQQRLGIDHVAANELEIEGGRLTGRVLGPIVNRQRKAELLRDLAARLGIRPEQTVAIGDGANDLDMLGVAGLGIAFHAKPLVRESAEHRISHLGLDGVLYLLGVRDQDLLHTDPPRHAEAPVGRRTG